MNSSTSLSSLLNRVPSPLCLHQQLKRLHSQVMSTLRLEQDAVQQVLGDIFGGVDTWYQQLGQALQSTLCAVRFDGAVHRDQGQVAQLLWNDEALIPLLHL